MLLYCRVLFLNWFLLLSCFTSFCQAIINDECGFLVIYEDSLQGTLHVNNIHKLRYQNDSVLIWSMGRIKSASDSISYRNFLQYNYSIDTFIIRNGDIWSCSFFGSYPVYSIKKFNAHETTFHYYLKNKDSLIFIERESYIPIKIIMIEKKKLYYYKLVHSSLKLDGSYIPKYKELLEIPDSKFKLKSDRDSYLLYNPGLGYQSISPFEGNFHRVVKRIIWETECKSWVINLFKSWN